MYYKYPLCHCVTIPHKYTSTEIDLHYFSAHLHKTMPEFNQIIARIKFPWIIYKINMFIIFQY